MSRITHLITADGQSIAVSNYNLDSTDFANAVQALRQSRSRNKTVAVNLYNASDAPFCLGSHLHADVYSARAKATAANYFSTFEMQYNAPNGTVTLVNGGGHGTTAAQVRYARFTGTRFRKPTYATANEAYRSRECGDMVVEIGVHGTRVVSLRVV